MWLLGFELRIYGRAVSALSCWAISLVPRGFLIRGCLCVWHMYVWLYVCMIYVCMSACMKASSLPTHSPHVRVKDMQITPGILKTWVLRIWNGVACAGRTLQTEPAPRFSCPPGTGHIINTRIQEANQEDVGFEASLGYTVRPGLQSKIKYNKYICVSPP